MGDRSIVIRPVVGEGSEMSAGGDTGREMGVKGDGQ